MLQRSTATVQTVDISASDVQGVLGTSFDSFNVTAQSITANPVVTTGESTIAAPEAIGGNRDLRVNWTSGPARLRVTRTSFRPRYWRLNPATMLWERSGSVGMATMPPAPQAWIRPDWERST